MAKASCRECGRDTDTRSMCVCESCGSYVCGECARDHRLGCETES